MKKEKESQNVEEGIVQAKSRADKEAETVQRKAGHSQNKCPGLRWDKLEKTKIISNLSKEKRSLNFSSKDLKEGGRQAKPNSYIVSQLNQAH